MILREDPNRKGEERAKSRSQTSSWDFTMTGIPMGIGIFMVHVGKSHWNPMDIPMGYQLVYLYGICIFTYIYYMNWLFLFLMIHVGKYTNRPMDPSRVLWLELKYEVKKTHCVTSSQIFLLLCRQKLQIESLGLFLKVEVVWRYLKVKEFQITKVPYLMTHSLFRLTQFKSIKTEGQMMVDGACIFFWCFKVQLSRSLSSTKMHPNF